MLALVTGFFALSAVVTAIDLFHYVYGNKYFASKQQM
jgi:hypothetical protein